ncbi:MAG: efflux RND transporter permease subunit [Alphaproteobacteria bacterium]|nr:efflux RND transporter permease subunit [Alphaproteobacteria bacterium]
MRISDFFIDRPIYAAVLSLFIFLAGLISLPLLPISEYPEVVPPSVVVNASYPGANPATVAETVATPLEEQINGVENMLYMNSQAASDGRLTLTVTFKIGTDPDLAQQLVQNRVAQATPRLPEVTRQLGVTTVKSSPDLTMVVHLLSKDGRYDMLYLRNYALLNVKDQLARLQGIGQVNLFGAGDYAMRVWLNPAKAAERGLSASEIIQAIRSQNVDAAAGGIGLSPAPSDTVLQLAIRSEGRLKTVEDFEALVVKRDPKTGALTRLGDIARIELGASEYSLRSLLDNKDAVAIPIFQTPGANALNISDSVRETMEQLKKNFPEGMDYQIVYDPTVFVRDSINAVIVTLIEAIVLVVLVVIVFLQTWRASIIPLLAVPISIVGTFAVMHLFGFSINALSLFGLVLAIGIVVDDAIVVVENVERNIERGLSAREATHVAMREVSGPIIAIALTLCAVFVPIAFITGLTGQFYKQFALTIAISTVISAFNSLTLSPALAALLLRGHDAPKDALTRGMDKIFGGFFARFNRFFNRSAGQYERGVGRLERRRGMAFGFYALLLGLSYLVFQQVPSGFIPSQDKQYLVGFAQLPDGANLDRTDAVIRAMSDIALKEPGVESAVAFPGLSINGFISSPSAGIVFVTLKPFSERSSAALSGGAIAQSLQQKFMGIGDAFIAIFPPPPVIGLGTIGGFKLQIQDRSNQGEVALNDVVQQVQYKAWQTPQLANVFSSYRINSPQLMADVDRARAVQVGVPVDEVFRTLQLYFGSLYINDFNAFGRTYQVIAQADAPFRDNPADISALYTKSLDGTMIPLSSLVTLRDTFGGESAARYNAFRAADINGGAAPGYSSGEGQAAMVKILNETLPPGFAYEWTELTYQQILAGNTALLVFPLCVLLVFMVLAAQYESLLLPLVVILTVPLCILSALTGVWIWGGDNNIFTQISLFVLAGLACKNAILIVEFARELEMQGKSVVDAALESCRLRLRPILMTSIAFIMGVVPLVLASGAGAEMRQAMGVAVFSGMIGVTVFGLILTPVFYVALRMLSGRKL